jgi:ELWxxDGT repeat protein
VIFQANNASGSFLWTTDGTSAGTQLVSSLVQVTSQNSVVMNGMLYFGGQLAPVVNATSGQLWRTDGTSAGTQQVTNLSTGVAFTAADFLNAVPGHVLFEFCSSGPPSSCALYSSDGTAAGTSQISPDPADGGGFVFGNRMVYSVTTATANILRVTDGTTQGTVDLLSAPLTVAPAYAGSFALVQGQVLFTRQDPVLGPSVWRTDGTVAGTQLVADVDPGTSTQSVPFGFTVVGNSVIFTAYVPSTGAEIYAMNVTGPNAADDYATASVAAPLQIPVLANDGSLPSPLNPGSVVITAQPTKGSVSVDPTSGVVTYTQTAGTGGSDQFSYTVADTLGNVSDPATVYVTLAEPVGPRPGTAPTPPPTSPPPASPPPASPPPATSSTSSSHGGGGTEGIFDLGMLVLLCGLKGRKHGRDPSHVAAGIS